MTHCATSSSFDAFAAGHLGELTGIVPPETVDAASEAAGGKERRLRRLPSRAVVYLLLASALFAQQGWQQVWARLASGLAVPVPRPARSSITQAMRRVGPQPLRELFTLLADPAPTRAGQWARFAGRLVVALDGTQVPVPGTDASRQAFPKPRAGPNGQAGYPLVRLVALIACGTRTVIDAALGPDRTSELGYARQLTGALRQGMLLADRGFATYQVLADVHATGCDFLIRSRTGRGAMGLRMHRRLADGSYLSRARGVSVRGSTHRSRSPPRLRHAPRPTGCSPRCWSPARRPHASWSASTTSAGRSRRPTTSSSPRSCAPRSATPPWPTQASMPTGSP